MPPSTGATSRTSRWSATALTGRLTGSSTVKRMMVGELGAVGGQLQVAGVGYRENIVGTGADDASDAVDRRVEFKTVECKR